MGIVAFRGIEMKKNSQKRIFGNYIYALTSNVESWYPYFKNWILSDIWIEVLNLAKIKYQFLLYAFCLNYNHFHILIHPNDKISSYSQIIQFLKRNTSRNINKVLGYDRIDIIQKNDNSQFQNINMTQMKNSNIGRDNNNIEYDNCCMGKNKTEGDNSYCRNVKSQNGNKFVNGEGQDKRGDNRNKFINGEGQDKRGDNGNKFINGESQNKKGDNGNKFINGESQDKRGDNGNKFINGESQNKKGDNRNCRVQGGIKILNEFICCQRRRFIEQYGENHNIPKFKWNKSYHDHIVRNEKDFQNQWHYIMYNFTKHELPENWKYTGLMFGDMVDDMG